jgi:hypothetical protein
MMGLFKNEAYIIQKGKDIFHLDNIKAFTDTKKAMDFAKSIDDGDGIVYIEVLSLN